MVEKRLPVSNSNSDNRKRIKELKAALDAVDATSVVDFDDSIARVPMLSTGIPSIDMILGGGVPIGRITELYGNESSGKTTLCSHIAAKAQSVGNIVTYVDMEHSYDPFYAREIGVDLESMILTQPLNGEKAFDQIITACETGNPGDVVILDSLAAIVPNAELEGDMDDQFIGLQARLIGKGLRKLAGMISKRQIIFIGVNQLREKVGVMYGNPETTPGGRAMKFYATLRLQLIRSKELKQGKGDSTGHDVIIKSVKNKAFRPRLETRVPLIYGKGFSVFDSLVESAIESGIITNSGPWYSIDCSKLTDGGEVLKVGQGKDSVKEYLMTNKDMQDRLCSVLLNNQCV